MSTSVLRLPTMTTAGRSSRGEEERDREREG